MRTPAILCVALFACAACQRDKGSKDDKSKTKTTAKDEKGQKPKRKPIPAPPDVKEPPADATKTASGLAFKELSKGKGDKKPTRNDSVKVHYTGWRTSGQMYQSTVQNGRPITMPLPHMPPGWVELLTQMTVSEKRRVWMPPKLATKSKSGHGPKEMIVYDVELLSITEAPKVPKNLTAPPKDATKSKSGLAYQQLKAGTGDKKPRAWDQVKVHFTRWTTQGLMTDSSVMRNRPISVQPAKYSPAWEEALALMVVGQSMRLWIPAELAKSRHGKQEPAIVDLELVSITEKPQPPPAPKNVKRPPGNAKKTKSGVRYIVLERGKGKDKPNPWDRVRVEYSAWATNGKLFESWVTRGRPADWALDRQGKGLAESLAVMTKGTKARFWIPEKLVGKNPQAPKGMLVYDIKLVSIERKPEPPKAPSDVAKPPASAKKTAKGVFYKYLNKPASGKKPKETDTVVVHYSGWTTDGKMFDSSVTRGSPATFPLNRVIAGWTDGLQVMSVKDKVRFWIPEELAYKGQPGRPAGMLVFDVELLEIK